MVLSPALYQHVLYRTTFLYQVNVTYEYFFKDIMTQMQVFKKRKKYVLD